MNVCILMKTKISEEGMNRHVMMEMKCILSNQWKYVRDCCYLKYTLVSMKIPSSVQKNSHLIVFAFILNLLSLFHRVNEDENNKNKCRWRWNKCTKWNEKVYFSYYFFSLFNQKCDYRECTWGNFLFHSALSLLISQDKKSFVYAEWMYYAE